MKKTSQLFTGLVAVLTSCLAAVSASADGANIQSWVSSTGNGIACTREAPCRTLSEAYNATFTGGVISMLDSASYNSTFVIGKSITIRAEGVDAGPIFGEFLGSWWSIEAGPSDVVTIEGMHFNSATGVVFQSGGQLHIVRCVFANSKIATNAGIRFLPNGASKLSVTDTVVTNMGLGNGGGIVIAPRAGGSAQAALERVTLNGNAFGLAVDGTNSTAGINVTVANSMIANNAQAGILAITPGGGAPIGVMVRNTNTVNNNIGVWSVGPNVTVRVDGSGVIGNGTGLQASNGGALLTAGNNMVQTNGSNGAFTGSVALQ